MELSGGVLGIVPARAGSKGFPGKNWMPLSGMPLIGYTARAARQSEVIDRMVLSTDSEKIADVGLEFDIEVPFLRPAQIAGDSSPMSEVIAHTLDEMAASGYVPDIVVLLQPTSPLRKPETIRRAVQTILESNCDSAVSVTPVPLHLCPDYVLKIENDRLDLFLPEGRYVKRRQDVRPAYYRDGGVYAFTREVFRNTGDIYGQDCRPVVSSVDEALSIDTAEDWFEAERRLTNVE